MIRALEELEFGAAYVEAARAGACRRSADQLRAVALLVCSQSLCSLGSAAVGVAGEFWVLQRAH